jgi:hypothetical protein
MYVYIFVYVCVFVEFFFMREVFSSFHIHTQNDTSTFTLAPRKVGAWNTDKYGLLFVDSPVGTSV